MKSKVPQTLAAEYADRRRCETEYKVKMPRLSYRRGGMWHTVYYAYLDGFAAGKDSSEPVAEEPKWIPVEESLPEPGQLVFMYVNYELDGQRITNLEYGYNDNGTWKGHRSVYSPGFVTHWMPLPKYPEEV
jgi:hypothetical protein